jgi:hypothetical protein
MEKAVLANNYEKKLVEYRDIVDIEILEQKRLQELYRQLQFAEENQGEEDDEEDVPRKQSELECKFFPSLICS